MNVTNSPIPRCVEMGGTMRVIQALVRLTLWTMTMLLPAHAQNQQPPVRIVAFGDSLTAGYRLAPGDAFPVKLEKALRAKGYAVEIANAGVSGDTTAAALERLDWAVPDGTQIVILEFGANDALRGLDPAVAKRNMDAILKRLQAKGARVLVAGMYAPRNWGDDYVKRFDTIFADLSKAYKMPLYPFFLDGVAMRPELNLDDGMHPNAKGIDEIVLRIQPHVARMLDEVMLTRGRE